MNGSPRSNKAQGAGRRGAASKQRTPASKPDVAAERAAAQAVAKERAVARRAQLDAHFGDNRPGRALVAASWGVTLVALALGVGGLAWGGGFESAYAVVTGIGFIVGTLGIGWALARAASRSRDDQISLGNLVFGTGIAPRGVMGPLWASVAAQTVIGIGIAVAAARGVGVAQGRSQQAALDFFFGSMLATFGLACLLLWGATFGYFPPQPGEPAASSADRAGRHNAPGRRR